MYGNLFGAPNRETFATSLLNAIRRAGDDRPIRLDRDNFCLQEERDQAKLFLAQAYDEYVAAAGRERRGVIERYVGVWLGGGGHQGPPETFAEARTGLMPRVRERIYFEQSRLQLGADIPFRLLSSELGLELVYERPEGALSLSLDQLEEWDITFEDALKTARQNLADRSREDFREVVPGFFLSPWKDGYDAARLLLAERLVGLEVKGIPVALAIRADQLAVTGSEDPSGLARLTALAQEALAQEGWLSPIPVHWKGGAWHPYVPPVDHAQYENVRRLFLHNSTRDYALQAPLLQGYHPNSKMTPYELARDRDTGIWLDVASWHEEGLPQLLPRASTVSLVRGGRSLGYFPWEKVQEVCGPLLEPLGCHPPRYCTLGFPTDEQITRMRLV